MKKILLLLFTVVTFGAIGQIFMKNFDLSGPRGFDESTIISSANTTVSAPAPAVTASASDNTICLDLIGKWKSPFYLFQLASLSLS